MVRPLVPLLRSMDSVAAQLAQAAVSLLTTLTFVRLLEPAEFGILAAIWSIWMLLMSMNRTVFGEQLLAQEHDQRVRLGYYDFGFSWSLLAVLISIAIVLILGISSLIPGLICVAMFVVSDMVRYGEMSRRASLGMVAALLPVELVRLVLSGLALGAVLLNLPEAWPLFLAMTSSLIWVFLGLRMTGVPNLSRARNFLHAKEKFEGLMVLQFLTGAGASQVTPLLALHAFGAAQFGGIRLAQSILSPMTLVSSAFQPTLIRFYASRRNSKSLFRIVLATVGVSSVVAAGTMLVALWVIKAFGTHLIPDGQSAVVNSILVPMVVLLSLVVIGQPGGALIKVKRLGGAGLWGQMFGTCATLVFCVIATQYSIFAFVWALAAGSAATVFGTYVLIAYMLIRSGNRAGRSRVADCNGI